MIGYPRRGRHPLPNTGVEVIAWGRNLIDQPSFTNIFNSYTSHGSTTQTQGARAPLA